MSEAHSGEFCVQPVQHASHKASSASQDDVARQYSAQLRVAGTESVLNESHDVFGLVSVLRIVLDINRRFRTSRCNLRGECRLLTKNICSPTWNRSVPKTAEYPVGNSYALGGRRDITLA